MAAKVKQEEVIRYAICSSAMGSEPRLRIMRLLLSAHREGLVVGEISDELGIAASTLSHHLEKLKNEDLVHVRREGTYLRYTANTGGLEELLDSCTRSAARAIRQSSLGGSCCANNGRWIMGNIKDVVKEKYGQAALRVVEGEQASCGCSPSSCCSDGDLITSNLYSQLQKMNCRRRRSLHPGLRNPTALAELKAGEIVLDLGSGGGIDVLLRQNASVPEARRTGWI